MGHSFTVNVNERRLGRKIPDCSLPESEQNATASVFASTIPVEFVATTRGLLRSDPHRSKNNAVGLLRDGKPSVEPRQRSNQRRTERARQRRGVEVNYLGLAHGRDARRAGADVVVDVRCRSAGVVHAVAA